MNSHEHMHEWPINYPSASQVCRSQWAMTADLTVFPKVTAVTAVTAWFLGALRGGKRWRLARRWLRFKLKQKNMAGWSKKKYWDYDWYVLFDNGISSNNSYLTLQKLEEIRLSFTIKWRGFLDARTSSYHWHCYVVPMITWLTVTPKKSGPTLRYSSMRAPKESMLRFCPHDLFAAGVSTRNWVDSDSFRLMF